MLKNTQKHAQEGMYETAYFSLIYNMGKRKETIYSPIREIGKIYFGVFDPVQYHILFQ